MLAAVALAAGALEAPPVPDPPQAASRTASTVKTPMSRFVMPLSLLPSKTTASLGEPVHPAHRPGHRSRREPESAAAPAVVRYTAHSLQSEGKST
ncbi:MAG: hypothetical protein NVSMB8_08070 [Candidatus Limnocylindrales bacterium]